MRKRMQGIVGIVVLLAALLGALPGALGAELWSDAADTSWFSQQHAGTEADPYLSFIQISYAKHLVFFLFFSYIAPCGGSGLIGQDPLF